MSENTHPIALTPDGASYESDQEIVDFFKRNLNEDVQDRIVYDRTYPYIGEYGEKIGLTFMSVGDSEIEDSSHSLNGTAFTWDDINSFDWSIDNFGQMFKKAWLKINS